MSINNRKQHWENVYHTKPLKEVGWYQPVPHTSLKFIEELSAAKDASIIDIGGGDSLLTDHLLNDGFTNLTVLDISEKAIERARRRLGPLANQVNWIVSDITQFTPTQQYDVWHDRAAFHFLTIDLEIQQYLNILEKSLKPSAYLVLGTFSDQGPTMCSGLNITQYSEDDIMRLLSPHFEKIKCIHPDHITPGGGVQNYTFCSFKRI
jgi:2-polyprenyl-3-methyl-5-hydroxy-6-metoxy-1,4-benzoquinol methylase